MICSGIAKFEDGQCANCQYEVTLKSALCTQIFAARASEAFFSVQNWIIRPCF